MIKKYLYLSLLMLLFNKAIFCLAPLQMYAFINKESDASDVIAQHVLASIYSQIPAGNPKNNVKANFQTKFGKDIETVVPKGGGASVDLSQATQAFQKAYNAATTEDQKIEIAAKMFTDADQSGNKVIQALKAKKATNKDAVLAVKTALQNAANQL